MRKYKWLYIIMLISMLLPPEVGMANTQQFVFGEEPITIDFDLVLSVPEQYRSQIFQVLNDYRGAIPSDITEWAVSAMEEYESWEHFTLVPSAVVRSGWTIPLRDDKILEIVIIHKGNMQPTGYVLNEETRTEVSRLLPEFASMPLHAKAETIETFLFPWSKPQQWYKTQGWHSGNSIDFLPVNRANPPVDFAVLASESGQVTVVCNDGYQKILMIRDDNNFTTRYVHLDALSVPSCIINHQVTQGQFLGLIYNGRAHVNGYCEGSGYQYNTHCGCGTGPHLHFEVSSRDITIDGHAINDIANAANYTKFRSSNQRDECDRISPHTDITLNNQPNGWPSWFNTPVTVHLHATDQGGSGVKEIYYQLDGGAWQIHSGHDLRFTLSEDGIHTLNYYAIDKASPPNEEAQHTVTFNIDTTPPSAPGNIIEGHGTTYGVWQSTINDPDFTWGEATDTTSGVYYYRIEWNNASNFSPTPAYDPPPVHTGSYVLTVRAVDYAGNMGPATSFRFNYDGTPPHAPDIQNLDGVASGVWQNQVRIPHFSWDEPQDAGAGIAGYYIYWGEDANGTTTTLTTTQSFALDTPICGPNEVASYYLRLRSQDKMGWQSDWVVFTFNYDGVPPTASLIANYGQEVVHQTRVHLDISASDLGSGVSGIRLSNEGRVWSDWLEPADELTWEIPSVGQREYDIYLQVRDLAGNVSEIVSDTVYLDVNVPRPHSETYDLWDGAVVGGGNTSTTTQHILNTTIQWHHAPTSVGQQYQMVSGFQAASQAAPTETPTTTQQYIQLGSLISSGGTGATPLQSSNYQLHGSLGQPSDMQVITGTQYVAKLGYWGGVATDVETEGPPPPPPPPTPECEFFSISINNGALYTNRPAVTLNVCGPDAEQIMLSNDGGFSDATWQPYTRTLSWTLTTYGNYVLPRYVYARFKSSDGNIHGTFFDDIIYDPHAPDTAAAFDPSQLLPGTHRPTGIEAAQRVNTDQVELFVSAQDDNSGLDEIQVSLRPDFAGAEWQAFSSIIPITFTQEGLQRVYIRTRDRAQNESSIASADIIIDRTPPTATVRMQDAIIGPDAVSVTLLVTATDALGKVTAMQISTEPAMTDTIWVTYTPKVVLYPDLAQGLTPTLYIRLRDEAGNESPIYTATYTVDVTPPWGTVDITARGETTATLHFSVEDDLSGVTEIMLLPSPWSINNATKQPYTDQMVWDFDNDSEVYVSFKDGAGNWSELYWVPLQDVPPMTITTSASPDGVVSSDNQITYTLSISTATGTDLTVYDPLIASTFIRFTQPISGIVYADRAITGSLTVTPTPPVTISFVVQVNISDTLSPSSYVANRACIYPAWSTSYNCVWSNEVTNLLQHDYSIYLPLVLRNR